MRFVKATERLPEKMKMVHFRVKQEPFSGFFDKDIFFCLHSHHAFDAKEVEWLDESIPNNGDADWVNVQKRLPKEGEKVLGLRPSGFMNTCSWERFIDQDDEWFKSQFTHWRPIPPLPGESSPANDILTAFQNEPVTFLLSNALRHLTQDQQRQLCNALQERLPVPASIEQEAERLYPAGWAKDYSYSSTDIILARRSAHITCARQYMDTIERLKAKIVSLEEELALYRLEK